jgi:hypothetical protein
LFSFSWVGLGFELSTSCLQSKACALLLEPHLQSTFPVIILEMWVSNCFSGLTSNYDSLDLRLPSSLDYRCEPWLPGVCFLDDSCSDWYRMESQCSFYFHFLYVKDIEHFIMYLFTICISSFGNCLFNVFGHLLIGLFIILVFNFLNPFYILNISPLFDD